MSYAIIFREAKVADIHQIQEVRHSVKKNRLSDPALVTDEDCRAILTERGKGWVCEINKKIVGFSIVDLINNNIWALFVKPENEKMGIGKKLHEVMLERYFNQTSTTVWLGTGQGTRAEYFYRQAGWAEAGMHGKEIKLELTKEIWLNTKNNNH